MKTKKLTGLLLTLSLGISLMGCNQTMADAIAKDPSLLGTQSAASEVESETEEETEEVTVTEVEPEEAAYDITLCFAGDFSLADGAITTYNLTNSENGIYDCISPELVEYMQNADLMCLNNEFTYSTRGTALAGKAYTFRGDPERVSILTELGVDLVGLANNHVYDYGSDAMEDTMQTLSDAGIDYVGAGYNLEEAMTPVYYEIEGKIVAVVAASRAEKNLYTPQATEDSSGILRCYDTELFISEIETAKENADYVIALVHWGTEYSTVLEDVQTETAHEYIDAGADVIIGSHSHCIQGVEYYNGCPIFYSLGNYWFNSRTLYSMLVSIEITGEGEYAEISARVIPALQSGGRTSYISDAAEQEEYFNYLESISVNSVFDENGYAYVEQ